MASSLVMFIRAIALKKSEPVNKGCVISVYTKNNCVQYMFIPSSVYIKKCAQKHIQVRIHKSCMPHSRNIIWKAVHIKPAKCFDPSQTSYLVMAASWLFIK